MVAVGAPGRSYFNRKHTHELAHTTSQSGQVAVLQVKTEAAAPSRLNNIKFFTVPLEGAVVQQIGPVAATWAGVQGEAIPS